LLLLHFNKIFYCLDLFKYLMLLSNYKPFDFCGFLFFDEIEDQINYWRNFKIV